MKTTVYTRVGDFGWEAYAFALDAKVSDASELKLEIAPPRQEKRAGVIKAVTSDGDVTRIEVEPFAYNRAEYTLSGGGVSVTRADVADTVIDGLDGFEAKEENGVIYRLYSPKAKGPRPLVLFLHGGGECGSDNLLQMVGTIGAIKIAADYPDVYVMAPQAPGGMIDFSKGQVPNMNAPFALTDQKGERGWHRKYLAAVCDLIREMIDDGKVNPDRIYVTGMSMGGAGTLRMLSVGSGLFAAAAPICPSMTPETFGILSSLTETKIWVSCAYVDHTIYRHKYIVDGILALRDAGNPDAHLTIYSPEELAAYGIATDPDMPLQAKFGANHACWILTYHNEHHIMDWLMSQSK